MSVERMKRLTVITAISDTDAIVRRLMQLKCVNIERSPQSDEKAGLSRLSVAEEISGLETRVRELEKALEVLHKYTAKVKAPIPIKNQQKLADFLENGYDEAVSIADETLGLAKTLDDEKKRQRELSDKISEMLPWTRYDVPLCTEGTEKTDVILGTLPLAASGKDPYRNEAAVREALAEMRGVLEVESRGADRSYCAVICHRDFTAKVTPMLAEHGFFRISFKDVDTTASAAIRKAEKEISESEKIYARTEQRLRELAERCDLAETLIDVETTSLRAAENKEKLLADKAVSILEGWVPERAEPKVKALLERYGCAYEFREPTEEDDPPVLLRNNAFASNFEWVVGMYSYPKYGRFDPTFIMSLFYFFIFGVMFADVGYGALVVLGCFGGILLLKPKPGLRRAMSMFGYCGISSIIFGAVFGGWFGDMPFAIMTNMLGMADAKTIYPFFNGLWFNPMDNPIMFLVVSLAVGVIHVFAGMAVKFYILCRDGQWIDAICDILSWWLLFGGIGLFFVSSVAGLIVGGAGVLMILCTAGRAKKGIFGKITGGLLGLYGIINYFSDILSYSRILALGLASAVIAQVVNLIGTMNGGVVGFIVMIVVFIFGHLLNLAINLLGTFVHTSRLQYLEFFGKFFEDGGKPFKPEEPSETYSIVTED